jgi:hypothetical protein
MSTSIYKILIALFLSVSSLQVQAISLPAGTSSSMGSGNNTPKKRPKKENVPLYQGISIGTDLLQPVGLLLNNSGGYCIKGDINLKNSFFPTLEFGYSDINKTFKSGINCLASGSYGKIGLNIPITYSGAKAENMFFIGLHYGLATVKYDLNNLFFSESYWENSVISFTNQQALVGWYEGTVGLRTQIIGPVSMGWAVQYKSPLNVKNGSNSNPAYVPGYGQFNNPNVTLNVNIYYKLPF